MERTRNALSSSIGEPSDLLPPEGGKVILVLLTGVGDVVHGLPLVNALKAHRPDLEITWVAEPAPAEVTRFHPALHRTVVFEKRRGLRGVAALYRDLRVHAPFHLALNLQRHFKGVFATVFSRARIRVGLARDKTRDGVSFFNTHALPSGPWKHTQDSFLDVLPLLGLPRPVDPAWNITFSEEEDERARRYFDAFSDRPRIGLVVGSAVAHKDWPADRCAELVDVLQGSRGFEVYLLGGPSERERGTVSHIIDSAVTRPVTALAGSVRELMWKIRGMDLLVSPDTGPLHLARALDVPVVGLYGYSNPWRVGPYGAYQDLMVDRFTDPGVPPDPSVYEPRTGRMERITVAEVLEKVDLASRRYLDSPLR